MKKRLTKKAPVRKYKKGGVNNLTPKTATEAVKGLSTEAEMPKIEAPKVETTKVAATAPVAKKRADGFESEAQKAAYIKNAKAMLAKDKTVADLVNMKFGTAAGLKALGITDSKPATSGKTTAPAKTTNTNSKTSEPKPKTTAPAKKENKSVPKTLTPEQKKAKAYRDQIVDTKSTYGKTKGNKSISTVVSTRRSGDKLVKVTSVDKGSATGAGWKTAYKVIPKRTQLNDSGTKLLHINKKGTVLTSKDKKTGEVKVMTAKNLEWKTGKKLMYQYDAGTDSKKYTKKK